MELRIKIPKLRESTEGFEQIAAECEEMGTFDASFERILRLLCKAAREGDQSQIHLLTVGLHAFLKHKGGNYSTRQPSLSQ